MDRTIKGFVTTYLEQYDLKSEGEATDLEKFANYCVFYSYQNYERFNIDNIQVGGREDIGLDGIGIIINNVLLDVENENELEQEFENASKLDITFIFTQTKNTNEYDRAEILDVFGGVKNFFSKKPTRKRNSQVQKKSKLALHLLNKWPKKIRQSPTCIIYYITNARKKPSQAIQEEISEQKSELQEKCETRFERVEVLTWGCEDLERVYRRTIHQVDTTVTSTTDLVDLVGKRENPIFIQGVNKAIIANLRFSEFKKIIMDESGKIRPFIFYDNVRGFLGEENQVNNQIKMTLDSDNRNRFAILNNGVTIIAHHVGPSSNEVTITDYQIVNGCQTSYVLYNWYKQNYEKISSELDEIVIPVKIIETDNDEVRNDIIKATNSQTAVQEELLAALSEFPKNLEDFYKSQVSHSDSQPKLYYERRPGQYNDSEIKNRFIVKVGDQIKAFAAMFLDLPYQVRYKHNLINKIPKEIFSEKHRPMPYYASSLASYNLEELFRQGVLPLDNNKHIHYHILMVFKYIVGGAKCPSCTNQKIEIYCENIIKCINNEEQCIARFNQAREIVIEKAIDFNNSSTLDYSNFFKSKEFTEYLIKELKADNDNLKSSLPAKQITDSASSIKKDKNSVIRVLRKKQQEEEHKQLSFELPEEKIVLTTGTQEDEYVEIPARLNREQLAGRFGLTSDTISRNRNNVEWTKKNDPDGIAWRYCQEKNYFFPLDQSSL